MQIQLKFKECFKHERKRTPGHYSYILCIWLTIQSCRLDEDIRIGWVKVYVPDRCCVSSHLRGNGNTFEVRRNNQVYILAWVGKQSHH